MTLPADGSWCCCVSDVVAGASVARAAGAPAGLVDEVAVDGSDSDGRAPPGGVPGGVFALCVCACVDAGVEVGCVPEGVAFAATGVEVEDVPAELAVGGAGGIIVGGECCCVVAWSVAGAVVCVGAVC